MNTYDDAMYNYLTIPDNYQAAKEVSELLSKVNERLKKEFWGDVKQKLEIRLKELTNDQERSYVVEDMVMKIYRKNWDGVSISRENSSNNNFDLGIKIDTKKKNIAMARQLIEQKDKDNLGLQLFSQIWPCWITIPFNSDGDFLNKLPNTRETKVSELVERFFNYVKIASDVCEEIGKQSNIPL
jgi:hypothetical protein